FTPTKPCGYVFPIVIANGSKHFFRSNKLLMGVLDSSKRATIGDHGRYGWALLSLDLYLHRGMENGLTLENGPFFRRVFGQDDGEFFSRPGSGLALRRWKGELMSLRSWKRYNYFQP